MMESGLKGGLAFLGGLVVVGTVAAFTLPAVFIAAAGPRSEIVGTIKKTEVDGLSLTLPHSKEPLVAHHHHFDRVSVKLDEASGRAEAFSTLDFTGAWGKVEVSALGSERTLFALRKRGWAPADGYAPLLARSVDMMVRRQSAIEKGDRLTLSSLIRGGRLELEDELTWKFLTSLQNRKYTPLAWYLRIAKDEVRATEAYRLEGSLPDRPIDEKGSRSLILKPEGTDLFFAESFW